MEMLWKGVVVEDEELESGFDLLRAIPAQPSND